MNADRPKERFRHKARNILLGVWLLGRGQSRGINSFSSGSLPFVMALSPVIAVTITVLGVLIFKDSENALLTPYVLTPLIIVLLQLVIAYRYARALKREELWPRYATAWLWCYSLILFFLGLILTVLENLASMIMETFPRTHGFGNVIDVLYCVCIGPFGVYMLWLNWYVTKVGLSLTSYRATLLTILNGLAAVLVLLWLKVSTVLLVTLIMAIGG